MKKSFCPVKDRGKRVFWHINLLCCLSVRRTNGKNIFKILCNQGPHELCIQINMHIGWALFQRYSTLRIISAVLTAVLVVTCTPMHSVSTKLGCILFDLGVNAVTVATEVYKVIAFRSMEFSCLHHIIYLAYQFWISETQNEAADFLTLGLYTQYYKWYWPQKIPWAKYTKMVTFLTSFLLLI